MHAADWALGDFVTEKWKQNKKTHTHIYRACLERAMGRVPFASSRVPSGQDIPWVLPRSVMPPTFNSTGGNIRLGESAEQFHALSADPRNFCLGDMTNGLHHIWDDGWHHHRVTIWSYTLRELWQEPSRLVFSSGVLANIWPHYTLHHNKLGVLLWPADWPLT